MIVRDGRVVLSAVSPTRGRFVLQPSTTGQYELKRFPPGVGGLRDCGAVPENNTNKTAQGVSPCPTSLSTLSGYTADDGTLCDVMVYYTPAALATAGSVANMNTQIDMAVLIANTTFSDSGINTQVRVVHRAEISYVEDFDGLLNLIRLWTPGDGFMDQVFAERDVHGGDLVTVVMDNSMDRGGAAFQPSALWPDDDGRSGFSVLRLNNLPFETMAHEFGHNYGCAHDRPNDPPGAGWYPYSHGYVEPGNAWQTIMAVSAVPYVPFFSNPNLNYNGPLGNPGPLGVPGVDPNIASDCVRTFNEHAFTVANFRPSKLDAPPASSRLYVDADATPGGDGSSWTTALTSMQDAIGVAVRARGAITEVWVASGMYTPEDANAGREAHFRPVEGVTFYGGFSGLETFFEERSIPQNPTILSGDIGALGDASDNSYHVIRADNIGPTAVFDGFIIRDGNANVPFPHNIGGGARVRCGGPTFANCTFRENEAEAGGGMALFDDGDGQLDQCALTQNTATLFGGGGLRMEPGTMGQYAQCNFNNNEAAFGGGFSSAGVAGVSFTTCRFEANEAPFGGGLDLSQSDVTFHNSIIRMNDAPGGTGGGIACGNSSTVTMTDCRIEANTAGFGAAGMGVFDATLDAARTDFVANSGNFGAGLWLDNNSGGTLESCGFYGNQSPFIGAGIHHTANSDPTYINCVFSGNDCSNSVGGAIGNLSGSDPTMINCSFANNTATFGGPAVWDEDGGSTLRNCVVWDHALPAIAGVNATTVVTYSNVQGGFAGVGNIDSDPLFANPSGVDGMIGTIDDDLSLLPGSPSIDAGRNSDLDMTITTDFIGGLRFFDDPDTPNTGVADARPSVDMGAYEYQVNDLPGDMNCDGVVSVSDIGSFVLALTDPVGYLMQFPNCNITNADVNGDNAVSVGDIGPFVALLTS